LESLKIKSLKEETVVTLDKTIKNKVNIIFEDNREISLEGDGSVRVLAAV
jgi:hypothetical protein